MLDEVSAVVCVLFYVALFAFVIGVAVGAVS
jgi:hypothetical protein